MGWMQVTLFCMRIGSPINRTCDTMPRWDTVLR
jgi:hypothetical protein